MAGTSAPDRPVTEVAATDVITSVPAGAGPGTSAPVAGEGCSAGRQETVPCAPVLPSRSDDLLPPAASPYTLEAPACTAGTDGGAGADVMPPSASLPPPPPASSSGALPAPSSSSASLEAQEQHVQMPSNFAVHVVASDPASPAAAMSEVVGEATITAPAAQAAAAAIGAPELRPVLPAAVVGVSTPGAQTPAQAVPYPPVAVAPECVPLAAAPAAMARQDSVTSASAEGPPMPPPGVQNVPLDGGAFDAASRVVPQVSGSVIAPATSPAPTYELSPSSLITSSTAFQELGYDASSGGTPIAADSSQPCVPTTSAFPSANVAAPATLPTAVPTAPSQSHAAAPALVGEGSHVGQGVMAGPAVGIASQHMPAPVAMPSNSCGVPPANPVVHGGPVVLASPPGPEVVQGVQASASATQTLPADLEPAPEPAPVAGAVLTEVPTLPEPSSSPSDNSCAVGTEVSQPSVKTTANQTVAMSTQTDKDTSSKTTKSNTAFRKSRLKEHEYNSEDDGSHSESESDAENEKEKDDHRHSLNSNGEDVVVEKSPLGRFVRFNRKLGTGAYKSVYLGYDCDTGREVAWNTISMRDMDKKAKKRITEEINMLKTLKHPRIIAFINAWQNKAENHVCFITERVTGGTLINYIRRLQTPLKLKVMRTWCRQILEGLNHLHTRADPIIHRDLKCDNIFINGNVGEVLIGDLGLSTTLNPASFATSIVGTPDFIAPEIYQEKYGTAVDIYAFGMCLLEMVSMGSPYEECTTPGQVYRKVVSGEKPRVLRRFRDEELRMLVDSCIDVDPALRPSASKLLEHPWLQENNADGNKYVDLIPVSEVEPLQVVGQLDKIAEEEASREASIAPSAPSMSVPSNTSATGVAPAVAPAVPAQGAAGQVPATQGPVATAPVAVMPSPSPPAPAVSAPPTSAVQAAPTAVAPMVATPAVVPAPTPVAPPVAGALESAPLAPPAPPPAAPSPVGIAPPVQDQAAAPPTRPLPAEASPPPAVPFVSGEASSQAAPTPLHVITPSVSQTQTLAPPAQGSTAAAADQQQHHQQQLQQQQQQHWVQQQQQAQMPAQTVAAPVVTMPPPHGHQPAAPVDMANAQSIPLAPPVVATPQGQVQVAQQVAAPAAQPQVSAAPQVPASTAGTTTSIPTPELAPAAAPPDPPELLVELGGAAQPLLPAPPAQTHAPQPLPAEQTAAPGVALPQAPATSLANAQAPQDLLPHGPTGIGTQPLLQRGSSDQGLAQFSLPGADDIDRSSRGSSIAFAVPSVISAPALMQHVQQTSVPQQQADASAYQVSPNHVDLSAIAGTAPAEANASAASASVAPAVLAGHVPSGIATPSGPVGIGSTGLCDGVSPEARVHRNSQSSLPSQQPPEGAFEDVQSGASEQEYSIPEYAHLLPEPERNPSMPHEGAVISALLSIGQTSVSRVVLRLLQDDGKPFNVYFDFDSHEDSSIMIAKELRDQDIQLAPMSMESLMYAVERAVIARCEQIAAEQTQAGAGPAQLARASLQASSGDDAGGVSAKADVGGGAAAGDATRWAQMGWAGGVKHPKLSAEIVQTRPASGESESGLKEHVSLLQRSLAFLIPDWSEEKFEQLGTWCPATTQAIITFQEYHKLSNMKGVVDEKSWEIMSDEVKKKEAREEERRNKREEDRKKAADLRLLRRQLQDMESAAQLEAMMGNCKRNLDKEPDKKATSGPSTGAATPAPAAANVGQAGQSGQQSWSPGIAQAKSMSAGIAAAPTASPAPSAASAVLSPRAQARPPANGVATAAGSSAVATTQ